MLRRTLIVLIGLFSMLAVVGSAVVGVLLWRQSTVQPQELVLVKPQALQLASTRGAAGLLVDGASNSDFRFPAVSPDGRQIAYITEGADGLSIQLFTLGSNTRTELYRSSINQPMNLAWSPDGQFINFLLISGTDLTLHVVPADGSAAARLIAAGRPSYYSWRADGGALLVHLGGHAAEGGRIELYRPGEDRSTPLLSNPGFSQAPAWSLNGQQIYYVAQPAGTTPRNYRETVAQIVRVDAGGQNQQALASEPGADVRMTRSPASDQIAYVAGQVLGPEQRQWGPLKIVDGRTSTAPQVLSRPDEQVSAFFWSPDGTRIAYTTYTGPYRGNTDRMWHIVDVQSGAITDFPAFSPSKEQLQLEVYFNAYTHSFSPWSPDSQQFSYGALNGVYVLNAVGGEPQVVGDGGLGLWIGGRRSS